MHCLPIIDRELRVAAKSVALFRQRMIVGGITAATAVVWAVFTASISSNSGAPLFHLFVWGGFILCLLEGLRETTDSISQERRDGTLGLLLLTDLRGFDVVIGKVSAAAIKGLTILLTALPVFALPIWLGGVTMSECWQVAVMLILTLFVSMAAGMIASAATNSPLASMIGGFFLLAALFLAPLALPPFGNLTWGAGPISMFQHTDDGSTTIFWQAALYSTLLSLSLFIIAGVITAKLSAFESGGKWSGRLWELIRPRPGKVRKWDEQYNENQVAVWLGERTLPGRRLLWLLVIGLTIVCFLIGYFGASDVSLYTSILAVQIVCGFLIKLWLAAVAAQPLHEARRTGALELLLCTPLSTERIISGQIDAIRNYFLVPVLIVAFGFSIAGIVGVSLGKFSFNAGDHMEALIPGFMWCIGFVLDSLALSYTGMWNGLSERHLHKAIAKTFFQVILLPWITVILPLVGCLAVFFWPIFWIVWSSKKLRERFHEQVASQMSENDDWTSWLPWKKKRVANPDRR